jgi:hypothetical protein
MAARKGKTGPGDLREQYLAALGLPSDASTRRSFLAAALSRAHELRKFEIENYWKRSNYFWLFQAAAFTLTGLIYGRVGSAGGLLLLPAGLGAITAQVGWLTARGSKFWQSNWESHVDFLEPELEGKLTQIILYQKDSVRSSVSKVNERLYALLFFAWVAVFINQALLMMLPFRVALPPWVAGSGGIVLLALAMLFVCWDTRSSLNPGAGGVQGFWDTWRSPPHRGELTIFDRSDNASRAARSD